MSGISEEVLTQQLRELEASQVLTRFDHQQVPPKVDYTVTPLGETLISALLPLCEWGVANRGQLEGPDISASAPRRSSPQP